MMQPEPLQLANGYYTLPRGKLVNVVTCLEMRARPRAEPVPLPPGYRLQPFTADRSELFRTLFAAVGSDLMWFSRLIMPEQELRAALSDPDIESFALMRDNEPVGLLELSFKERPDCELAFFGLKPSAVGTGLGKALMSEATERAWSRPIERFWVHTCNTDHPRAIAFYKASGFAPHALMIEVHDDPRISGHLPPDASPQIALLRPEPITR